MPRMLAKKTIAVDSAFLLKLSVKRNEENLATLSRRASGEAAARAMKDSLIAVLVVLVSDWYGSSSELLTSSSLLAYSSSVSSASP
jgi:hypothetical protein